MPPKSTTATPSYKRGSRNEHADPGSGSVLADYMPIQPAQPVKVNPTAVKGKQTASPKTANSPKFPTSDGNKSPVPAGKKAKGANPQQQAAQKKEQLYRQLNASGPGTPTNPEGMRVFKVNRSGQNSRRGSAQDPMPPHRSMFGSMAVHQHGMSPTGPPMHHHQQYANGSPVGAQFPHQPKSYHGMHHHHHVHHQANAKQETRAPGGLFQSHARKPPAQAPHPKTPPPQQPTYAQQPQVPQHVQHHQQQQPPKERGRGRGQGHYRKGSSGYNTPPLQSPASSSYRGSPTPSLYSAITDTGDLLCDYPQTFLSGYGNMGAFIDHVTPSLEANKWSIVADVDKVADLEMPAQLHLEVSYRLEELWRSYRAPFGRHIPFVTPVPLSCPSIMGKQPDRHVFYTPYLSAFHFTFAADSRQFARMKAEHRKKAMERQPTESPVTAQPGQASRFAPPNDDSDAESTEGIFTGFGDEKPPSRTVTYTAVTKPDRRLPLWEEINELIGTEDDPDSGKPEFRCLRDAYSNDFECSSWYAVLWSPIHTHGHESHRSCGSFITYHLVRAPRHIFTNVTSREHLSPSGGAATPGLGGGEDPINRTPTASPTEGVDLDLLPTPLSQRLSFVSRVGSWVADRNRIYESPVLSIDRLTNFGDILAAEAGKTSSLAASASAAPSVNASVEEVNSAMDQERAQRDLPANFGSVQITPRVAIHEVDMNSLPARAQLLPAVIDALRAQEAVSDDPEKFLEVTATSTVAMSGFRSVGAPSDVDCRSEAAISDSACEQEESPFKPPLLRSSNTNVMSDTADDASLASMDRPVSPSGSISSNTTGVLPSSPPPPPSYDHHSAIQTLRFRVPMCGMLCARPRADVWGVPSVQRNGSRNYTFPLFLLAGGLQISRNYARPLHDAWVEHAAGTAGAPSADDASRVSMDSDHFTRGEALLKDFSIAYV